MTATNQAPALCVSHNHPMKYVPTQFEGLRNAPRDTQLESNLDLFSPQHDGQSPGTPVLQGPPPALSSLATYCPCFVVFFQATPNHL